MIAAWWCWLVGHRFPPVPDWRAAGRGRRTYFRALGARARRRAVRASRICERCGWRKGAA